MPEGDTAYRAAYHLARALTDQRVIHAELRVPRYAMLQLAGLHVHGAESRGKHILLRVGRWTVHSHLGMDGSWLLLLPRTRRGWPAAHRIRARLDTDAVIALGVDLARLRVWPTEREQAELGWLGPGLLDPHVDLDLATTRILTEPERSITAALLDQANVAGLGNEYVTELCFLRGVLPCRAVAECGDIREWLELARRLMVANRDRSIRTFTGRTGRGETNYVFARAGRPCRRCGSTIVEGTHASGVRRSGMHDPELDGVGPGGLRVSAWCPNCQR